MKLTRRKTLALGAGTLIAAGFGAVPASAATPEDTMEDAIAAFTGGADMVDGGIDFTAPEIAENGNTVPVAVSAPGASAIIILATGNPGVYVATFNFGLLAGSRTASTRMRLIKTQEVVAIAKMEDGTFHRTSSIIKVTIGGCGG